MFSLRKYQRAIIILIIALVSDLAIRVILFNHFMNVAAAESVFFILISLITFLAAKKDKAISFKAQRFDLWLSLFFLLGGIRAMIWALHFEVYIANIIVIILGIIFGTVLISWLGRNRQTN